MLFAVANGSLAEVGRSVRSGKRDVAAELREDLYGGAFDQLSDDHGSSAGYGRSGVWHEMSVRLCDAYVFVAQAESLRGDLTEDGVGSLAELGRGDQDSRASGLQLDVEGKFGGEATLTGAGEACAVKERCKANALFYDAGCVFFFELF